MTSSDDQITLIFWATYSPEERTKRIMTSGLSLLERHSMGHEFRIAMKKSHTVRHLAEVIGQGLYADRVEYLTALLPNPEMLLSDPAVEPYTGETMIVLGCDKLTKLADRGAALLMLDIGEDISDLNKKIKKLQSEIEQIRDLKSVMNERIEKYMKIAYGGVDQVIWPGQIGLDQWTRQQLVDQRSSDL